MVLLHSCKSPTKSAGSWDIQAAHLLSMPINPESLSYGWTYLVVWIESIVSALSTVVIASSFITFMCIFVVVCSTFCLTILLGLGFRVVHLDMKLVRFESNIPFCNIFL